MKKLTATDLDKMAGIEPEVKKREVKTSKTKITSETLDALAAGDYQPPEGVQLPKVIEGLKTQKEVAQFLKDSNIMLAQGAVHGFGDEGLAAIQTGSISSPEYVTKRDEYRSNLDRITKESPIMSPVAQALGSTVTTAAIPFMGATKAARVGKEILSSGLQGTGDAPSMQDVPKYAGTGAAISGALEGAGQIGKHLLFDDPTKILTRSIGVRSADMKGEKGLGAVNSVERLRGLGFFDNGEKYVDPNTSKFVKVKELDSFFKPQTLESLNETAEKSIIALRDKNKSLIKGKVIPPKDFMDSLNDGVSEMFYDPEGFDAASRMELADSVVGKILYDLQNKFSINLGKPIPAEAIEITKRSLDMHTGSPAFKKRAEELGLNPEALMLFRTKLDELVDTVGGQTYKKNNDLMSDLITVKNIIKNKENKSYLEAGNRLMDNRGWADKVKDIFSPTPVDIGRSNMAEEMQGDAGEAAGIILKRSGTNRLNQGRSPNSTMLNPKQVIKYRIPRSTEGILQNKELVLAKIAQAGVPDELYSTIAYALNESPEQIPNVAPLVMTQFPQLFEQSKYKIFDGVIVDPNDKARMADDISKRDDLDSIQRAKMISQINKTGKAPEGMV